MCNRYRPTRLDKLERADELREMFGIEVDWRDLSDDGPLHLGDADIYPLHAGPILRLDENDRWIGEVRHWGLLPPGWKPVDDVERERKAQMRKLVNARAESIHTSWPWKLVWRHQRCVLPAVDFYEPHADGGQARYSLPDHPAFLIPGLFHSCEVDDRTFHTYTMLTCQANSVVASTRGGERRDRQPVVFTTLDEARSYCDLETIEYPPLATLLRSAAEGLTTCTHEPARPKGRTLF